ncbi:hypothetical protein DDB_G0282023 [Dictyostelium discoideum AX4]|uniref:Uncharacterized protein n=1 Tax=Dictyostelium discoideum TaxID=44689 RepID=Q54T39_DICDI|nr:hypothetical protein DDB_G0282023 [Dictyostelium discoideum AX4]EAL66433.1 hypothetical protein DDB_G0282023 [Dictyostelium discoideum AX4]|eukprot:XP_640412.1 hypothetical protein DDB_G0282023 [Dictyostelium discoideum AX4]
MPVFILFLFLKSYDKKNRKGWFGDTITPLIFIKKTYNEIKYIRIN